MTSLEILEIEVHRHSVTLNKRNTNCDSFVKNVLFRNRKS